MLTSQRDSQRQSEAEKMVPCSRSGVRRKKFRLPETSMQITRKKQYLPPEIAFRKLYTKDKIFITKYMQSDHSPWLQHVKCDHTPWLRRAQ